MTGYSYPRRTVGAVCPLTAIGLHQALAEYAAQRRHEVFLLVGRQRAALRIDNAAQVQHATRVEIGYPELLADLFGGGGEGRSFGRLVGHFFGVMS